MVQKFHICEKVYFDQLLDFRIYYYSFTLYYCAIFYSFNTIRVSNSLDPDQAKHFVGPDLGPNYLQRLSGDIVGKELNTKRLVDTFWLKPWLKLISLGSNYFHLAKVLATTNSEPG